MFYEKNISDILNIFTKLSVVQAYGKRIKLKKYYF